MSLIVAQNLSKTYATDSIEVKALQGVSLEIAAGSYLAFVGPSASGAGAWGSSFRLTILFPF